ncbi:putative transcriptional elongation factor [Besnoitia besnoiti]|uniref:FACT complex subunit n=1 Tax=Besnoitia besnoiti TaxID=94643 RepID=A0A2A9MEK2_BESBE|nr:putative transcriptional elongation factor [Besnoitia besnoiti]PFH33812.1 putative transcriptional elongation factor [Besnoitia besnoiti]
MTDAANGAAPAASAPPAASSSLLLPNMEMKREPEAEPPTVSPAAAPSSPAPGEGAVTNGASVKPPEVKEKAEQEKAGGSSVRTVTIDGGDVKEKLDRLFNYWNSRYAVEGDPWEGVDIFAILVGKANEEEEGKPEQMQMWLTGFQFPETLFVFTRSGEWLVLTSPKKLEHLRQIETCREGISLLSRSGPDGIDGAVRSINEAVTREATTSGKAPEDVVLGCLQSSNAQQGFAQQMTETFFKKFTDANKSKFVDDGVVITMAVHTPVEIENIRSASIVSVAMMKTQIVNRIETVLDNEQHESHATIAGLAEKLLKDGKQVEKLRERHNIDPAEVDLLYSNVQSGEAFDLRASAQPTTANLSQTEGAIIISLGVKYKELCAALARTLLLNGTKEQKEMYSFTFELLQHVISLLKPGASFSGIYADTRAYIEARKPGLSEHFLKMAGHCMGIEYRSNSLVLNPKNTKTLVERGMIFNITVGFSHLTTSKGKTYAIWLADTVLLPKEEGAAPVVLTDGISKTLRHVSYELEDAEEKTQEKTKSSFSEKKESKEKVKKGEDDEGQKKKKSGSSTKHKESKSNKEKEKGESRKSTAAGGGAISATILNNAESVILKDRLRRRTGSQAATAQQEAEERDERQRQLRKKKSEQLRLRFDNEKDGGGLERKKKEGKKMEDIKCFASPEAFPRDLKTNKLYVDFKSESLLVPIHGSHLPFHLSTVKNVTCSETQGGDASGGAAAGKNRSPFFVLRVNFQVPGSQTLTLKGEENPLPDLSGRPDTVFIKELMFKSEDGRHLQTIFRTIKEQLKRVKQKALEDDVAGEMTEQDKLILNRTGRRVLLKDLMIRPNIAPGMRKLIGTLEAHTNGLRFTVNTRGQIDQVDITYSNIKHAMFQPCERELIVLIHFHLKSAIMVGKKRTQDVQFYTEAGTQTDDLDNRRNRSFHDPDETQDEMRERELKRKLNNEFKRFVQQVEDIAKVEFDLPYRELRFTGVPMKSNVEILPTANCLVHLIEWPPFVLPLEDIELVSFERVAHGLRNFDVIFVFQDYTKPVKRIDLVPIEFLDNLKRWLNELEIVWYEGKQNLNWNAILKQIRDDPHGFVEAGGFEMFLGDDSPSGEEGDTDEDDDDEEYAESESESEYEGSGEEQEDGEEGSSEDDSSDSDDDESLADESDEDEEYNDVSSDEEEGLSWDELEERAKKEDRKRRTEDSDEDDERRKKKRK